MLRAGIIGAGAWARHHHLPRLAARSDEVAVVALCTTDAAARATYRAAWPDAIVTDVVPEALAAGLDLCIVASPPALHAGHARAALEAGAHVLVEKPFTLRSADAWALVALAAAADRHLLCAFNWNEFHVARAARDLLAAAPIGEIEAVTMVMSSPLRNLFDAAPDFAYDADAQPEPATWLDPDTSGGGYASGQLAHGLAFALALTGLRATEVFMGAGGLVRDGVERHVALAIRFAGGAIGSCSGTTTHSGPYRLAVDLAGADGDASFDLEEGVTDVTAGAETASVDVLVDLALGRDVDHASSGVLAARVVEIVDAATRSVASGRPERVPEPA